MTMSESLQLVDLMDTGRGIHYPVKKLFADETTRVQRIVIAELERFPGEQNLWIGAAIDDWKLAPQFSTHDEEKYHWSFAGPVLATAQNPRTGIILGGGDWPLAARIAMRQGIEHVLVADWDKRVGELVIEHIPKITAFGVHLDPRFDFSREIDVADFLPAAPSNSADFIFGDLTDVRDLKKIEPRFLWNCHRVLRQGGFVAFQAGEYGMTKDRIVAVTEGYTDLMAVGFDEIWLWQEYINSFAYPNLWMAGWKGVCPSREPLPEEELAKLFKFPGGRPQHYSPAIHRRAFTLDREYLELIRSLRTNRTV